MQFVWKICNNQWKENEKNKNNHKSLILKGTTIFSMIHIESQWLIFTNDLEKKKKKKGAHFPCQISIP